ncbi:hypothetical protein ACIP5L_28895 [Streptomyces bacillaris]|uniref:hypothetical protein n=1 Tax=Streptomyces bacillaris TaxID=68179 RepID=UPI0038103F1B
MTRIHIPGEELADAIDILRTIQERIAGEASLEAAGTADDAGDGSLRDAIHGFDAAWQAGQERVRENADTFRETVEGILHNFGDTDEKLGRELDE